MTARRIQETIAQCVSTMVFYHGSERSGQADGQMAAEIRAIAGSVEELGSDAAEIGTQIVHPIRAELVARYGHELGPRLFGAFVEAFEGIGATRRESGRHRT